MTLSITTTKYTLAPNEQFTKTVCEENKWPYILCDVEMKNGKKKPRSSTIPKGWTEWSFEKCMEYNKQRADPKCAIMNINLNKSNMVVVDIDGGDNIQELKEEYGNEFITKSINRKLPHLWFKKAQDDPYSTKTKVGGDEVDYLYQNVFENIDSVMTKYDATGGMDEFDWQHYIGKPTAKTKTINSVKKEDKANDITHPMLDMIAVKYWTNYTDWFKLLSAIKNEFENYEQVACHYACVGEYQNNEDDIIEKLEQLEAGPISMGTIHHYARISNPDEYAKMLIPKIENDDQGIAELFLNAFGENIVRDIQDETYIYYHGEWKKHNKEQSLLLKGLIYDITLPIVEKAIEINKMSINNTDSVSEREKLTKYEKNMMNTRAAIRSAKGTDAVFRKICSILAMRKNSKIVFDIGKDQLYNIHFKNGVYNLKTMKFRERERGDYVTQTLEYNYFDERNEDNMNMVESIYNKLQPNKDQHLFTMEWLASHLDGNISREKFKMNVGVGSNGKTMEFSIHNKALSIYCKKFNNEVFNKDFTKQHKEYFDLSYKPVRLVYIEELDKSKKLNIDKMKDFITGKKLPLEIMYGTQKTIDIQATLNICSNSDPNAETDGGILRRGLLQRYESIFVDTVDEDDWENHIFIKEEGIDDQFEEDKMKLAYFHVLLKYYNTKMTTPKMIQNEFRDTLEEYDTFKQVFEKHFMKCVSVPIEGFGKFKGSAIHKDVVVARFECEGIKGWRKVLGEMKRMGIKYNKGIRVKDCSGRGAFMDIRLRDVEEEVEDI